MSDFEDDVAAWLCALKHALAKPIELIDSELTGLMKEMETPSERLPILLSELRYLSRTLRDLEDYFCQKSEFQFEAVTFQNVWERALLDCQLLVAERGQRLVVDCQAHPVLLEVAPQRLAHALVHLVENASRFSDYGKSIKIEARIEGDGFVAEVRDGGIGIAAEDMPHIFEAFYRAQGRPDAEPGGIGLGLAVVRRIVEGHGGTVAAFSPGLGQGTTIRIGIPTRSRKRPPSPKSKPASDGAV